MNDITREILETRLSYEKKDLADIDSHIARFQEELFVVNQRRNKLLKTIEALEKDLK